MDSAIVLWVKVLQSIPFLLDHPHDLTEHCGWFDWKYSKIFWVIVQVYYKVVMCIILLAIIERNYKTIYTKNHEKLINFQYKNKFIYNTIVK